jgi:NADH-quinone oxidoreductase subunit A
MEHQIEYIALLIVFLASLGVAGAMLALHSLVGPKNPTPIKSRTFECGKTPFALPRGNFSIKFYLIAMLFILFDVEIVWFFPWAVVLRELGWVGIIEMFSFVAVLGVGFAYAWKKGAMEWAK